MVKNPCITIGHTDRVLGVIGRGPLRCLQTRYGPPSSFHVKTCHLLTDTCQIQCNPMENIMTSCDLIPGHSDLIFWSLGDMLVTIINHAETDRLHSCEPFVPHLNLDQVRFQTSAVTLRKGSRSNGWYVRKGLGDSVLPANQFGPTANSL